MRTTRTYNPCDECPYSYSRTGEESNICKICELTHFKDLRPKNGEWVVCGDGDYVPFKCTACGNNTSWYHKQTAKYCPNCGAKMFRESPIYE